MNSKNKVTVHIYNRQYTVVANENVDYIHKVAEYVNRIMSGIIVRSPSMSYSMAAILTAMNAADDYIKTMSNAEKLNEQGSNALKQIESANKEIARLNGELERIKSINARLQASVNGKSPTCKT